jgi:hypothetical protein
MEPKPLRMCLKQRSFRHTPAFGVHGLTGFAAWADTLKGGHRTRASRQNEDC